MTNKKFSTLKMVELAFLTAVVLVLQLTGTAIKISVLGTSVSLVLIPIVLGAVMIGPSAGAWLGFVFGAVVFLMGAFGLDAFTQMMVADNPIMTFIICFAKGILAGLVAGIVYKALIKKNRILATFAAAAAAPIVNTGLFILGSLVMSGTFEKNASNLGITDGMSIFYFLVIVCAGVNFIFELLLNIVASPVIIRVSDAVGKVLGKKNKA